MEDEIDDEETFEKEVVAPNEACYIDVEPIDLAACISLNDSLAELRAEQYRGRTKTINGRVFPVWDARAHERPAFYTSKSLYTDQAFD